MPNYVIWSNEDIDPKDFKDYLDEYYPDADEQEQCEAVYELNGAYLDDERMNLNVTLEAPILAVADMGLWGAFRVQAV